MKTFKMVHIKKKKNFKKNLYITNAGESVEKNNPPTLPSMHACSVTLSCLIPTDCHLPESSVHGIF